MASKGQRWLVDSGILRKKNGDEEPQELLVFGYGCKLFRDDEKAKMIDQGKHLIPWMGDSTLKIDRYDGRGALADLRSHEPPSGGYDQRTMLTEDEIRVEQLCDDERYHSLHNNDVEEASYHEEEIKRLHQALGSENTYGQVSYNYNDDQDSQKALSEETQSPKPSDGSQDDEDQAFVVPPELEIPEDMTLPETQKLNAIISKTALFISRQGGQMEILIKAKQANNPQFSFLSIDGSLHPYYRLVLEAIKSGKYNPEKQPEKEESVESAEESDEDDEPYLHPSLASSLTKVEAAPSIPSIQYKPSADCAYSMLVNKITGKPPPLRVPPPLPPEVPVQTVQTAYYPPYPTVQTCTPVYPPAPQQYSHGPVLYGSGGQAKSPPRGTPTVASTNEENPGTPMIKESVVPLVPYGPTPPKPLSRPSFIVPPADVQIIIDKMASYVAKNGRDFEAIVKNKGDPRFNFLELSHQYHGYYAHKLTIYEGAVNPKVLTEEELLRKQEPQEEKQKKLEELQKKQQRMEEVQKRVKMIQAKKKTDARDEGANKLITTVSFSIKKPKDGDAPVIEKRSALPLEESDEEVDEEKKDNGSKTGSPNETNEDNNRVFKIEKETTKVEIPQKNEEKELVDLTDDIFEDCQKEVHHKETEEDRVREKTVLENKEKHVGTSRERLLQLERKKKAAMFLSQIVQQTPIVPIVNMETRIEDDDSDEIQSLPSPSHEDTETSSSRINAATSLMNRLKSADLSGKRPRPQSRSRSGSRDNPSDRHRSHKKHKKKKTAHRSHDSPSGSRSHKSKKSKKSVSRHRTRSRSPGRRHQSEAKRSRAGSDTSSSNSSEL
ncbi:splicing factor, suppressor of white-apricot homolog isoform X3 [Venturia canescens]|uniref:splicing factor, suppressor of white-apricot homolog isoform X3 n=1 Tax=Venturia canescens TaxID=32260 RepID=UPI001C9D5975|nr:splicing factor, suppressor of white-apricot homolog isoform X3 [Venturia canescens]